MSERARGSASGLLIHEFLRDSQDRERLDIPRPRLRLRKHDWQITPRLSFKVDANVTTDDLVLPRLRRPARRRARQRAETNVFLTQRWDAWSLVGNVFWYQDLTTPAAVELQRVPEIRLFGVRQPVPGLPGFLYETEASFVNFYRDVGPTAVRARPAPARSSARSRSPGCSPSRRSRAAASPYYNQHVVGTARRPSIRG